VEEVLLSDAEEVLLSDQAESRQLGQVRPDLSLVEAGFHLQGVGSLVKVRVQRSVLVHVQRSVPACCWPTKASEAPLN
jgi:hypothetical protein